MIAALINSTIGREGDPFDIAQFYAPPEARVAAKVVERMSDAGR